MTEAFSEGHDLADLQQWAVEALVVTAAGEGIITTGHASELLGLGYFETLALLKKRGIPNPMTEEDLCTEQAHLKAMFPDSFSK